MKDTLLYKILRFLFTPVFKLYFRPTIIGNEKIPKEGSIILAGNHKHALDPILVDVTTNRCVHALAKSELFEGFFGMFFKAAGCIPVYLEAKSNPEALSMAIKTLKEGKVINVSPEAERNYTEKILLPFKKGAIKMSKETGAKILPYCIVGDYKFLSKDLKIVYGDIIDVSDMEFEEANDYLFEKVKELLVKYK